MSRCTAPAEPYWLGVLFGYKIVFQAIGVFLAFKIRKVKIRGLNESREVSAILYITSVILVAMIVATFPLGEYIDVEAVIFGVGICTATTVVLALTFVPKVYNVTESYIYSSARLGCYVPSYVLHYSTISGHCCVFECVCV